MITVPYGIIYFKIETFVVSSASCSVLVCNDYWDRFVGLRSFAMNRFLIGQILKWNKYIRLLWLISKYCLISRGNLSEFILCLFKFEDYNISIIEPQSRWVNVHCSTSLSCQWFYPFVYENKWKESNVPHTCIVNSLTLGRRVKSEGSGVMRGFVYRKSLI